MASPTDKDPAAASAGEPAAEEPKKSGFGKEQIIATIVTLIILAFVFLRVFPQLGDYDQAFKAIQNMTNAAMIALLIATIAMVIIYVYPFQAALPGINYGDAFMVRQTSFMISNVIPAGGAIGLGVQFGMLNGYGFGAAASTAAIGITSVWNVFVTLSLPVLAALLLLLEGYTNGKAALIAFVGVLAVGGGIVLFALILRSEELARKIGGYGDDFVAWAAGLINKEWTTDLADGAVEFRSSVIGVVADRWGKITVANVAQQLSQFFILYVALLGIGGGSSEATLLEAFAAFAFARLMTFIPVPPGGLGTVDAAMTAILVGFGVPNNDAMAATLIWRGATFFPQIIIGIGTFLVYQRGDRKPNISQSAS